MSILPENIDGSKQNVRELSGLFSIAQALSEMSGQEKILHEVLDSIESDFGLKRPTVMLLSPSGSELVYEATKNPHSLKEPRTSYQKGEGITGRVLQAGQPAIIHRITDEPDFRDRLHKRDQAESRNLGFICVPITLQSEVVGTLAADYPHESPISIHEAARLLWIVASMIAHDVKLSRQARLKQQALEQENLRLRNQLEGAARPASIIGNSRAMRNIYERIQQVANTETSVLIRGESGTGKELVASAIHYAGTRSKKPFIKVNCAALSENLLESELFGHEKGAFTGAMQTRIGRIEEADGGTLFLDEIGEFSPNIQVKLLRVLQEKEFQRVGSNQTHKTDFRLIAATNRDLEAAVDAGAFRQDLYYRINVFAIHLPPLRERRDDIMPLADFFVAKYTKKMGKYVNRISTTAINMMQAYHWPGNVRELENCIEHAVLLTTDGVIHGYNLPPTLQTPDAAELAAAGTLKSRIALLERDMIIDALKKTSGSVTTAANELGITPRMIRYKIKNLNIDYQKYFKKRRTSG